MDKGCKSYVVSLFIDDASIAIVSVSNSLKKNGTVLPCLASRLQMKGFTTT